MQSESWTNKQIKVKIILAEEVCTIVLPSGESFALPMSSEDKNLFTTEDAYLILSPSSVLPTQQELAKLVLKEILKPNVDK